MGAKVLLFFGVPAIIAVVISILALATDDYRHRVDRAHEEGREAGKAGVPVGAVPHPRDTSSFLEWKKGWIEGFKERRKENQHGSQ